MTILDDLLATLGENTPVREVSVGVHWTAVCSRSCGLASTLTGDKPHGHEPVRDVGHLERRSALELAGLARSENLLEASIGVAAINSMIQIADRPMVEANAARILAERGRGKDIALVGHFPFIPELRKAARKLWVIEHHPAEGEHPAQDASELIPRADVVAITGMSLINHTLEGLLGLCRPRAFVMLLGPSTPLSPVLFDHGIAALSGVQVVDEDAVLRTIRQGATFRQVEGARLIVMSQENLM